MYKYLKQARVLLPANAIAGGVFYFLFLNSWRMRQRVFTTISIWQSLLQIQYYLRSSVSCPSNFNLSSIVFILCIQIWFQFGLLIVMTQTIVSFKNTYRTMCSKLVLLGALRRYILCSPLCILYFVLGRVMIAWACKIYEITGWRREWARTPARRMQTTPTQPSTS